MITTYSKALYIALLAIALLLAGCSAHKRSSARASTQIEATTAATLNSAVTTDVTLQSWLAAMADSAAVRLSADSIVTLAGIIYRPAIDITLATPRLHAEAIEQAHRTDTTATTQAQHVAYTADAENISSADGTAIAEPPDGSASALWLAIALIIAGGCVIAFACYIVRKVRNCTRVY